MRIVMVVAVVSVVLVVSGCGRSGVSGTVQPVEIHLLAAGLTPPTEESFAVGDIVRMKASGTVLGTVTDVAIEQSPATVADSEGLLHESRSPLLVDVTLTIEGEAVMSEKGYLFSGEMVRVNDNVTYVTPLVLFEGRIVRMRVTGDL